MRPNCCPCSQSEPVVVVLITGIKCDRKLQQQLVNGRIITHDVYGSTNFAIFPQSSTIQINPDRKCFFVITQLEVQNRRQLTFELWQNCSVSHYTKFIHHAFPSHLCERVNYGNTTFKIPYFVFFGRGGLLVYIPNGAGKNDDPHVPGDPYTYGPTFLGYSSC